MPKNLLAISLLSLMAQVAPAADVDPCTRFTWDVSHELAVFKQAPQPVVAATRPSGEIPELALDQLYEVKLTSQSGVTFAITPGKPTLPDGTQAGLVRFKSAAAGHYRVALTSGHWVDVADGQTSIQSHDFQGARGCEHPRKIVEFELPAQRSLILQLSGAADTPVTLAITTVKSTSG